MPRFARYALVALAVLVAACSGGAGGGGPGTSSSSTGTGAGKGSGGSGGTGGAGGGSAGGGGGGAVTDCSVDGNPGQCLDVSACAAQPGYESTPGYCPGPTNIQCCTMAPSTADNPPIPTGYKLMSQADVTPDMTTWAVEILNDPTDYPMFSTAMKTFGTLMVLARVEWHPPDFNNEKVHRGVTLYEPE